MDDASFSERLLIYGLAAFHIVFFIVLVVLLLYSRGILGDLLSGLNTLVGYVIFGALWATTWWTTRRAVRGYLKELSPAASGDFFEAFLKGKVDSGRVIVSGMIWGGVNGFLFLIALALMLLVLILLQTVVALLGGSPFPGVSATLILVAVIASPVGVIVGGVVGFLLGIVDAAVLKLVRQLLAAYG